MVSPKGDLTNRPAPQVFPGEYEKLRAAFNATAETLQDASRTIPEATGGITAGSNQIAHASDDLARRTGQQAANLGDTAAALDVIAGTVKTMAAGANAAARAGDAGRGFAVVASEVRALAPRSAEAAKQIKALIPASTAQLESGVVLVDKTGVALKEIAEKVAEMDALVRQISAFSKEQATGLAEINTAVTQMDQAVQQNAAMVEESTAAAHALKSETEGLTTMAGRFQTGAARRACASRPSCPSALRRTIIVMDHAIRIWIASFSKTPPWSRNRLPPPMRCRANACN